MQWTCKWETKTTFPSTIKIEYIVRNWQHSSLKPITYLFNLFWEKSLKTNEVYTLSGWRVETSLILKTLFYRVSHGEVNKVIWLGWGYKKVFLALKQENKLENNTTSNLKIIQSHSLYALHIYLFRKYIHNKPQYVLCKTYHKKEDTILTTISPPQSFPNNNK